ncbi:MAG: Hpt domain-containing protein [Oligoflexia bacterium]|nr:Hpt domain-containing protein [Oligoflexia bacterium]
MIQLDDLQIIYMQSLKEKIELLDKALVEKDLQKVISLFHKMAGSGKTYGFNEISELGFYAETKLKVLASNDMQDAAELINQLKFIYNKYASGLKVA